MSLQSFFIFRPACFAINMAFGPNNVLSFGRLAALAIMIAIAGLGLGALLLASQTRFMTIKLAGAGYLVWIGVKLIRSGPALIVSETGSGSGTASIWRLTRQEFWVAAGNPKAIPVVTAFLPQFVDRSACAVSFSVLGATFLLLELVAIFISALLGARLGSMSRGARGFAWFNRINGALMIGFGVMPAFVRRPAA